MNKEIQKEKELPFNFEDYKHNYIDESEKELLSILNSTNPEVIKNLYNKQKEEIIINLYGSEGEISNAYDSLVSFLQKLMLGIAIKKSKKIDDISNNYNKIRKNIQIGMFNGNVFPLRIFDKEYGIGLLRAISNTNPIDTNIIEKMKERLEEEIQKWSQKFKDSV